MPTEVLLHVCISTVEHRSFLQGGASRANAVEHGLSNARVEATNTHLRLLTRRAYGYRSPESLIAMADLTRGGLCPPLPGRS